MHGSKRTIFLLVSLCVFLSALGVSAAGLVVRYRANLRNAGTAFQDLRSSASRALSSTGPSDQAWRDTAKKLYRNDDSILLVTLHAPGEGILYMVPKSAPYLAQPPGSIRSNPEFLYPPQTVTRLSAVVGTQSGIPVTLDVLYALLRQRDVYEAARLGLIIAAAWTAFSLLAVTAAGLRSDGGKKLPALAPAPTTPALNRGLSDEDFDLPEFPSVSDAGNPFETSLPDVRLDEMPEAGEAAPSASSPRPKGLYSPVTGLGWEEYLPERLASELSRAASFEQDLVLLLLSHQGISRGSASYKRILDTLLEFFSFRDLAFEQGPAGFAVILPNMDSGHALRMSEEFLKKITARMREEDKSQDYRNVYIGLSSRAGRLVEAQRILAEARSALQRAREEADSRIVAFRADPNKYRDYLAAQI